MAVVRALSGFRGPEVPRLLLEPFRGFTPPVRGEVIEALLARPERFLEYLVERMLAGHEQDDDVTVLVMHVPASGER